MLIVNDVCGVLIFPWIKYGCISKSLVWIKITFLNLIYNLFYVLVFYYLTLDCINKYVSNGGKSNASTCIKNGSIT